MLSWVFLQKSLALWALYLGVKIRRAERWLIWLPHSQPYEGGDHPDLLPNVPLSFWPLEFCPPTGFLFAPLSTLRSPTSMMCVGVCQQPRLTLPDCSLWSWVLAWLARNAFYDQPISNVSLQMTGLVLLRSVWVDKGEQRTCWTHSQRNRISPGAWSRYTGLSSLPVFDYLINLYSLFHIHRKCVLYVLVWTVTKLAHTFSLCKYVYQKLSGMISVNLTEQQLFPMICQEWYCLS